MSRNEQLTSTEIQEIHIARKFAYGFGHVLNDLCASMWFSYLLLFYQHVLSIRASVAGYLMLLGQLVDAAATPLVGYGSDKVHGFCMYSKRKSWHLVGTILVAASFPFLFITCLACSETENIWLQFAYYGVLIVVFQIGWAVTQISHLALIPELTTNPHERVELNAIRFAFTVISAISVYTITWIMMKADVGDSQGPYKNASQTEFNTTDSGLSNDDAPVFMNVAIMVVCIGVVFSICFHLGISEKGKADSSKNSLDVAIVQQMVWKDWFKQLQFYQIGGLYMCTRLVVNLSQVYMPFFLTNSLEVEEIYIAVTPLIVYISGFFTSSLMKIVSKMLGSKVTYIIGAVTVLAGCTWFWFLSQPVSKWQVIVSAVLLGSGCSSILVMSLSMTAELIGDNTMSGAFVYGCMSFTDKVSNGVAIVMIQNSYPCQSEETCCTDCVWFYKYVMVFVICGIMVISLVFLATLWPQHIGKLKVTDSLLNVNLKRSLAFYNDVQLESK